MTSSQMRPGEGIWVVGATFGAHYARALQGQGLRAIIGRGGEKGRQLAQSLACDYFSAIDRALTRSRPACAVVAVRSSIVGGEGDDIARRLLQADIPVLQELPVHPQEMVNTLRVAQLRGIPFHVTPFYDQMPSVRRFLRAARRLAVASSLRSVEMRVSVQTLHCALFVLSELLGAPSPAITVTPMASFAKILVSGSWQGVAVDMVLMNRFDAASPDDNSQPLMQIVLLSDDGELMLHSPYGPVIWERRLQPPQSLTASRSDSEDEALLLAYPQQTAPGIEHVYRDMAAAIRASLARFMASDTHDSTRLQRQLAVLQLWQTICTRAGHPRQQSLAAPAPIGRILGITDREDE
ncbi:hypothetical protein EHN07_14785 [Buttiauxella warmboldiae]|uniref:Uncharacterized protein n=1 Tax=Buttiauxella warmboldiae TaxID=82993 RepID=A0A3N5D6Q8_9ENTR|nr:Gfo/Idh/MocA family oxidoreductase [Buttiauxella warmboldiae]RPH24125.1 hypothetical protein EHN07_14785 [Buttiauxella warmboldiae]